MLITKQNQKQKLQCKQNVYHVIKYFGPVEGKVNPISANLTKWSPFCGIGAYRVKTESVDQSIDVWLSCLGFTILNFPNLPILKNFVYATNININYWGRIYSFFIISNYESKLYMQREWFFMFFFLLTIIEFHAVNSQTFSWCWWLKKLPIKKLLVWRPLSRLRYMKNTVVW